MAPENSDASDRPPPAWSGWVAGGLAASVALVVGELVEGASEDIPGLVLGVGEWIVDITPGDIVAEGIENIGTSQKTWLVLGITTVSILLGGLLGRLSQTVSRWIGPLGFGAFGLLGGFATARNPLSPAGASWFWALVAAAIGAATLWFLLARLDRPTRLHTVMEDPRDTRATRRAFLSWSAGAGAMAVTGLGISRGLERQPSRAETAREALVREAPTAPAATGVRSITTLDPTPGITPYITPNDGFYRIDTALRIPQVDPADWSLQITGMVDEPIELTYDDIRSMDLVDRAITLSCVSNEVGGDLVGNAVWTGVPLTDLLDRAGVQEGATQVVGRSVDDWTAGFPTEVLYDGRNAMLAILMNGEPLPIRHGFPARLVVSGLYGYVSAVKWIEEIHLTTWEEFDGYWVPRGWSKEGPMKTMSRIDVPRQGEDLVAGAAVIAGVAWSPNHGISAVELSVDDGPWTECELGEAIGPETWLQWRTDWDATPGRHVLRVRAVDGTGEVQPIGPASPRPDGAEGWHTRSVDVA